MYTIYYTITQARQLLYGAHLLHVLSFCRIKYIFKFGKLPFRGVRDITRLAVEYNTFDLKVTGNFHLV